MQHIMGVKEPIISILADKGLADTFSANGVADGPCSQHKRRRDILEGDVKRRFFDPTCDEHGFYAKKQCHSGHCWCSDRDGNLIAGSKKKGNVDCGMYTFKDLKIRND